MDGRGGEGGAVDEELPGDGQAEEVHLGVGGEVVDLGDAVGVVTAMGEERGAGGVGWTCSVDCAAEFAAGDGYALGVCVSPGKEVKGLD